MLLRWPQLAEPSGAVVGVIAAPKSAAIAALFELVGELVGDGSVQWSGTVGLRA